MRIKNLEIYNFRSLKEFKVPEFGTTTIFYGENNAGKSNVLNALQTIFKRKQPDATSLTKAENFYGGLIPNSKNNFYNNYTHRPITFLISIDVNKSELSVGNLIKSLFPAKKNNFLFSFKGEISFLKDLDGDYSEIKFEEIKVDNSIIYSNKADKITYFPTLRQTPTTIPDLNRQFNSLINIFNDCIYIINSDRDMHDVSINDGSTEFPTPKNFKKFLYDLYLSPQKHYLFEEINEVFSKPPFSYGNISFSEEADKKLQLMVKENDFRLPIKHLGSGVLQSLYIITDIVFSKSKIIGIEELEQNLSPNKQIQILRKIQSMVDDDSRLINQVIISSHSSVYSKPKLGVIYFLEKANGWTQIYKTLQKVDKARLLKHLSQAIPQEYTQEELQASINEAMVLAEARFKT